MKPHTDKSRNHKFHCFSFRNNLSAPLCSSFVLVTLFEFWGQRLFWSGNHWYCTRFDFVRLSRAGLRFSPRRGFGPERGFPRSRTAADDGVRCKQSFIEWQRSTRAVQLVCSKFSVSGYDRKRKAGDVMFMLCLCELGLGKRVFWKEITASW